MESLHSGSLLKVASDTVAWTGRKEFHLLANEIVFLIDSKMKEALPGLMTVDVFHHKHGLVTCLLCELTTCENHNIFDYN